MRYEERVLEFAARNNLSFQDPILLRTALTHRSFLNEHADLGWSDNERLEFLGDAVLHFVLADYLFEKFPYSAEGDLTGLRAALVRCEMLAEFGKEMAMGEFLLMGRGELETGGAERLTVLCDAFEALVAALYLDQGLEAAKDVILPMVAQRLAQARTEATDKDPKSRLNILAQARVGLTPQYRTTNAVGPDHAVVFTVQAVIGNTVVGEGQGPSKQLAAQRAAAEALEHPERWDSFPTEPQPSDAD